MKTSTKALFGGALMAAGMTAHAQQFVYAATSSDGAYSSFAYSVAYAYGSDVAYGPAALNTYATSYTYLTGTTTTWTTQTNTSMGAYGSWDGGGYLGYGYGGNQIQQFFEVSEDADLLIEWDVSGTDGYAQSVVLTYADGSALYSWDGFSGAASGSATISLSAGTEYAIVFGLNAGFFPFFFDTDTQYITATLVPVPAPATAGLLGLAGLAATRRRR